MVASRLNPLVLYTEPQKPIDPADEDARLPVYELNLPITGKHYLVALGKPKLEFTTSHNLVYYPIYLVKHNRIVRMIGVFEIEKSALIGLLDASKSLRAENLEPILFETITEEFLNKVGAYKGDLDGDGDGSEDESPEEKNRTDDGNGDDGSGDGEDGSDDDRFGSSLSRRKETDQNRLRDPSDPDRVTPENLFQKADSLPKRLPVVPMSIAAQQRASKRSRDAFIARHADATSEVNWVQDYMKSSAYKITSVTGNGDCLFLCIVEAYRELGMTTTVQKLRRVLAQETNQAHFNELRAYYSGIAGNVENIRRDIAENKKKNQELKTRVPKATKAETARIAESAAALKRKHDELTASLENSIENLSEVAYMRHVATLSDLQAYLQTQNFWADTWVISILERVLSMKLIIMQKSQDKDDVIQCGQLNEDVAVHEPKHYILVAYDGEHYDLITADGRRIFTFEELPFDVRMAVVLKCKERSAGSFGIIPDFKQFRIDLGDSETEVEELGTETDAIESKTTEPTDPKATDPNATGATIEGKGEDALAPLASQAPPNESSVSDAPLYDPAIMFRFHSESDSTRSPGDVNGEKLPKKRAAEFADLAKRTGWRQQLDDSWIAPFSIDHEGAPVRWASVVHYVYGTLLRPVNAEAWHALSMDSGTSISKSSTIVLESVSKKGGKPGKYYADVTKLQATPEYSVEYENARKVALFAKFKQPDLITTLHATRNAQLLHFVRGKAPESDTLLMLVRRKIR